MIQSVVEVVVLILKIVALILGTAFGFWIGIRAYDEMFGDVKIPKEWKEADERRAEELKRQRGQWR